MNDDNALLARRSLEQVHVVLLHDILLEFRFSRNAVVDGLFQSIGEIFKHGVRFEFGAAGNRIECRVREAFR